MRFPLQPEASFSSAAEDALQSHAPPSDDSELSDAGGAGGGGSRKTPGRARARPLSPFESLAALLSAPRTAPATLRADPFSCKSLDCFPGTLAHLARPTLVALTAPVTLVHVFVDALDCAVSARQVQLLSGVISDSIFAPQTSDAPPPGDGKMGGGGEKRGSRSRERASSADDGGSGRGSDAQAAVGDAPSVVEPASAGVMGWLWSAVTGASEEGGAGGEGGGRESSSTPPLQPPAVTVLNIHVGSFGLVLFRHMSRGGGNSSGGGGGGGVVSPTSIASPRGRCRMYPIPLLRLSVSTTRAHIRSSVAPPARVAALPTARGGFWSGDFLDVFADVGTLALIPWSTELDGVHAESRRARSARLSELGIFAGSSPLVHASPQPAAAAPPTHFDFNNVAKQRDRDGDFDFGGGAEEEAAVAASASTLNAARRLFAEAAHSAAATATSQPDAASVSPPPPPPPPSESALDLYVSCGAPGALAASLGAAKGGQSALRRHPFFEASLFPEVDTLDDDLLECVASSTFTESHHRGAH